MKQKRTLSLILCIAVPLLAGLLSALISSALSTSLEWLATPPLAPSRIAFMILWPVLYLLIGFALFLVLQSNTSAPDKRVALVLFIVQLALHFVFAPVFFRFQLFWLAFVLIVFLDIAVILCARVFHTILPFAGWLMVPYLLWLLFTSYLTLGCALLN